MSKQLIPARYNNVLFHKNKDQLIFHRLRLTFWLHNFSVIFIYETFRFPALTLLKNVEERIDAYKLVVVFIYTGVEQ